MRFKLEDLPEHMQKEARETMAKEEAKAAPPVDAPPTAADRRQEVKMLHGPFRAWLGLHDIPFVVARPDKASGIKEGWPDFTIMHGGRVLLIEFKWPGQKLRAAQQDVHDWLTASGVDCVTLFSVESAIETTKEFFKITI